MSASPTPAAFELAKDNQQEEVQVKVQAQNGNNDQISAADYDPSLDRREDEQRRFKDEPTVETIEEEEVEEDDDDVDDMFALESEKKVKKVKKIKVTVSCPTYHVPHTPLTCSFSSEVCCSCIDHHHSRLCSRSGRLLYYNTRRTTRWWALSGIFFLGQRHVCKCCPGSGLDWRHRRGGQRSGHQDHQEQ